MFDNGKVKIKRAINDGVITESFIYDHLKAIEDYKAPDVYCQVNVNIPNTYLKSILDLFDADDFRFTDGKIHRNDDKFILKETNSIIISYIYQNNNNKYVGKKLIHDGETINIIRNESDLLITQIVKENKNERNDNL